MGFFDVVEVLGVYLSFTCTNFAAFLVVFSETLLQLLTGLDKNCRNYQQNHKFIHSNYCEGNTNFELKKLLLFRFIFYFSE